MRDQRSASSALTNHIPTTRRQWLGECATFLSVFAGVPLFARHQQLPPGVGVAATPPCDPGTKPTPPKSPKSPWRANAPLRSRLAERTESGTALSLGGAVIGLRCGYIAGASVDLWHADAKGLSDASGMRLRGRQLTNTEGHFQFDTVIPGAAPGQAPRVNIRVTVPGKATLTTVLFLPERIAGAANARDRDYDELLRMTLIDQTASQVKASFNVILDL